MRKRARALMDLQPYAVKCGEVLEASHQLINALAESGDVDPHPDAIAYALGSGARVVPFQSQPDLVAAAPAADPAPKRARARKPAEPTPEQA